MGIDDRQRPEPRAPARRDDAVVDATGAAVAAPPRASDPPGAAASPPASDPPPPPPPGGHEVYLRHVFDAAMDGIFIADPSGRFVDCNASACAMLRCTREQLLACHIADIIEPDDLRERPVDFGGMRSPSGVHSVRRLHARDGSVVLAEVAARALPDGYFVGIARDLSDQGAAGEALARSEASFRALIEALPDGVAVHRDGRYIYANPALMRMLGLTDLSQVRGTPVEQFVHPDDRAVVRARVAQIAERGETVPTNEERLVRADGSVVWAEVCGLRGEFQGAPAVIALARDVTERRRIQAQLALADRMASVGTLAAGVAHEVNNPLAFVLLNLEALCNALPRVAAALGGDARAADALDPDRVAQLATRAAEAMEGARRVQQIVRDLKTFAHAERARRVAVHVPTVLDTVLDMAAHELKYRARVERVYGPVPEIVADEGRIAQVLLNLVLNAAQAIPEGDAERNVVRVRTAVERGEVLRIDVEDTGCGIAPEHRAQLFVPFFTTKPMGVGAGLGLYICHNIVRAMGGRIEVESTPGQGSRFSVLLPLAAVTRATDEENARAAARAAASEPGGGDGERTAAAPRRRLLLVDDEPLLRASLAGTLASQYVVVACGSGREARELLARDAAFDVVLCDLMMPVLSGMDLYDWAAGHAPALARRFVFMTGGAFTARAQAFVEKTTQPILDKPFATDQLLAAVARVAAMDDPRP